MLEFVEVKQRVTWLVTQKWKNWGITKDEVVGRTAAILRFDAGKLADENGDYLPLHEVDEETRAAINGVEVQLFIGDQDKGDKTIATKKYKVPDKVAAARLLMQQMKLIGADVAVSINVSMADRLAAARKRARERSKD